MFETFGKIWNFCKLRHKTFVISLVCFFIKSIIGITQLAAIIITINTLAGTTELTMSIWWIVGLTLICVIGNYIVSYIEQISSMKTGYLMTADNRVNIANTLKKVPLGYFNSTSAQKITATLTSTLGGVESASIMVMGLVCSGLFNTLALFIFIMFYEWRIGLIAGIGMILYILVINYQMKVSRRSAPALQQAQTNLAEKTLTFLKGIKVTKAFSFTKGNVELEKAINNSKNENIKLTKFSMPSQYLASITVAVFESIILIVTLYLSFKLGQLDLVHTIVLLIFSFMVFASLNQAGSMLSMIGLLDSGLNEVEQIQNVQQLSIKQPTQNTQSNQIVLKNVCFAYGKNMVINNISTTIEPNSLTAIIGPSGSGKTTMCQLIPRFHDVLEGSISIGGANIQNIPYEELMQKISMVFQNVYLFEDTILNNIKIGNPNASMDEVIEVCKKAQCHNFITKLPNGYDTIVEEGGVNLSGGEKQRISIARAMLKNSPIIILDEATSALDAENEHEILSAIDELIQNKTVIMIAHRIQTVQKANHIIAIENGKIVQEGTHNQLYNQKGLYQDFVNARANAKGWTLTN